MQIWNQAANAFVEVENHMVFVLKMTFKLWICIYHAVCFKNVLMHIVISQFGHSGWQWKLYYL